MATAPQCFRYAVRGVSCRHASKMYSANLIGRRRAFSATGTFLQSDIPHDPFAKASKLLGEASKEHIETSAVSPEEFSKFETADESLDETLRYAYPPPEARLRRKKFKDTVLNIDQPEPWQEEFMENDDSEDLPMIAHGELEQHREMRHYARLAAWEMPLLAKLAKPFVPPSADMPLRFRYTTYMGEQHPAESKVVLEFSPADMRDLTPIQMEKLKKLVGVRYNPEKNIVRMSSELFPTQAQNKRYLGDLVETLLKEAKDPNDTFEDVPLDLRHHKFKPRARFPREWAMTDVRKQELGRHRQEMVSNDQQLESIGRLIDGVKQIEKGFANSASAKGALPEMSMSGRGGKGMGKRVSVRR